MADHQLPAPWSDAHTTLAQIRARLTAFNEDREWGPYHRPKDLAMAVAIESAELLERWLWKAEGEAAEPGRVVEEMADVLICLINLANRLDVDLAAATEAKIRSNDQRYPVELARGRAEKYDELRGGSPREDGDRRS